MCITGSTPHRAAQPSNSFLLGYRSMGFVTKMKILWVLFTSDLTWRSHHSLICKKVNCMSGVVNRLGKSINVDKLKKVIHAFVLPHIRYCLPVWCNANTGSYTNRALERTIRIILYDRKATFDNQTRQLTNIISFKISLFFHNVCRIHCLSPIITVILYRYFLWF